MWKCAGTPGAYCRIVLAMWPRYRESLGQGRSTGCTAGRPASKPYPSGATIVNGTGLTNRLWFMRRGCGIVRGDEEAVYYSCCFWETNSATKNQKEVVSGEACRGIRAALD